MYAHVGNNFPASFVTPDFKPGLILIIKYDPFGGAKYKFDHTAH